MFLTICPVSPAGIQPQSATMPMSTQFGKLSERWHGQKYSPLPEDERKHLAIDDTDSAGSVNDDESTVKGEEVTFPINSPRPPRRLWLLLSLAATIALAIITTSTFAAYKYALHKAPALTSPVTQCGSTPEEARSLGCIFEVTLSLWVPPQCYDSELEKIYLQQPGLNFYRDVNLTDQVSIDDVKLGSSPGWFVPWDHHIRHCEFAFRKLHRAAQSAKYIDGYVLQYAHTEHCLKMFTEPEDWRTGITQFDAAMWPNCNGKEGGYNVNSKQRNAWT